MMRKIVATAAVLLVCAGCAGQHGAKRARGSQMQPQGSVDVRSTCDVSLQRAGGDQATLVLAWATTVTPEAGRSIDLTGAFESLGTHTRWLWIYLDHAALVYADGGDLPPSVRIVNGPTRDALAGGGWWFAGSPYEGAEWSESTLALRRGERIVRLVPDTATDEGPWLTLTPETYRTWYRRLDESVGLERTFGE